MTERLAWEIQIIEAWHMAALLLLVGVNFAIWLKARRTAALTAYLAVEALLLVWMVAKMGKTVSPEPVTRWGFIVLQYVSNCFLGAAFLFFAHAWALDRPPSRRLRVATLAVSAFFFLLMATNPLHMLFYSRYDFFRDAFGPAFYAHQAWTYLLLLGGIALCASRFMSAFRHQRRQALLVAVAVLVPLVINYLYVAGWFKPLFGFKPRFDITPITTMLSLMLFALGTWRYRFFDISTLAWRSVLDHRPEGVALVGPDGRWLDGNRLAMSGDPGESDLAQILRQAPWRGTDGLLSDRESPTEGSLLAARCLMPDGRSLAVRWSPEGGAGGSGPACRLIRFADETEHVRNLEVLGERNARLSTLHAAVKAQVEDRCALAVARTRNRFGREVHDGVGHAVVYAISLLEVARRQLWLDAGQARERTGQAVSLLAQAGHLLEHGRRPVGGSCAWLSAMRAEAESSGQRMVFHVPECLPPLDGAIAETGERICREAAANAVRHGRAGRIDLFVRATEDALQINVIDDGVGCGTVIKGYGLAGLDSAVGQVGGEIAYGPMEPRGFAVRAVLPLRATVAGGAVAEG